VTEPDGTQFIDEDISVEKTVTSSCGEQSVSNIAVSITETLAPVSITDFGVIKECCL